MDKDVTNQLDSNMITLERLLASKSSDYGRAIEMCGQKGLAYRLLEKMTRIMNLTMTGAGPEVGEEDIRTTLEDMAGIALLGTTYLDLNRLSPDGNWKECMAWQSETP